MNLPGKIMFDRSAFLALIFADHPDHSRARLLYERHLDWQSELWTTNYVLFDMSGSIGRDEFFLLHSAVDDFFHLYCVPVSLHREALEIYKSQSERARTFGFIVTSMAAQHIGANLLTFESCSWI